MCFECYRDMGFHFLFATKNGFVCFYEPDQNFHIELGNMLIQLSYKDYIELKSFIVQYQPSDLAHIRSVVNKKIILKPSGCNNCYCFSDTDYEELKVLFAGSSSILQIEKDIYEILGN